MPLRLFKCPICGTNRKLLKKGLTPMCDHNETEFHFAEPVLMEEVITAPTSKMMEATNKYAGKSKVKGLTKTLKARAREHARDREAEDLISFNRKNGIEGSGFLTKAGTRRKKVDDL